MTGELNKTVISILVGCLSVCGVVAEAQELQINQMLQPQGLEQTGIYSLRQIDPTLTGAGVKFAVICRSYTYIDDEPQNDYRPFVEHNSLSANRFKFYDQALLPIGISPHSTAICSILFSEDTNAFHPIIGQFSYEGVVPQAEVDIYEFWHFVINNVFSQVPPDVDVVTADFGYPFEEWWTRGIESLAEHYGIIVVAGIGNGTDASDPVLYPAAGSNVIGVGVVDSVNTNDDVIDLAQFALAYPEHSSSGPTTNGRCKPDIVAPGNCLAAVVTEPNQYEPTGNFSSFSMPVVAGTVGLLVQKAKQDPNLAAAVSPDGGNCLIKAILLNSARKLPYWHKGQLPSDDDHFVPLDYIQGAGMVNAIGAYDQLVAGQQKPGEVFTTGWDINQLNTDLSTENIYRITITEPADKMITVTAVWNRHYENVWPFLPETEKDSDLRLELWALDLQNPANSYLLDYSDSSVDNVEHIYVEADESYTSYELVLTYNSDGDQQPLYINQRYGLAWNVGDKQEDDSIFWYDLNADGIVDNLDLTIMLLNILEGKKSPDTYRLGDINMDGSIDVNDFRIFSIFLQQINRQTDWQNTQ